MTSEYGNDFITVQDDEGNTIELEVLDTLETEEGRFIAVMPAFNEESPEEYLEYDGELFILQVIEEDGEEQFATIDDDELFDKIFAQFEKRLEDYYEIKIEQEEEEEEEN